MKTLRKSKFFRCILLPLALFAMSACQTTQLKSQGYAPFNTNRELPSVARPTLNDGSTVSLPHERCEADSVRHIENQEGDSVGIGPYLLFGAAALTMGLIILKVQMDEMFSGLGQ